MDKHDTEFAYVDEWINIDIPQRCLEAELVKQDVFSDSYPECVLAGYHFRNANTGDVLEVALIINGTEMPTNTWDSYLLRAAVSIGSGAYERMEEWLSNVSSGCGE